MVYQQRRVHGSFPEQEGSAPQLGESIVGPTSDTEIFMDGSLSCV